jgi:hypothetical protein
LKVVSDSERPCEFWPLRVALEIEIREVALLVACQATATLGIEHLWSGARQTLTDNRRSMRSARLEMLGVKLCMSEQEFDTVYDELMSKKRTWSKHCRQ